jgi:uncharacterized membrane protein
MQGKNLVTIMILIDNHLKIFLKVLKQIMQDMQAEPAQELHPGQLYRLLREIPIIRLLEMAMRWVYCTA